MADPAIPQSTPSINHNSASLYDAFCEARNEAARAWAAWLETKPSASDVLNELDATYRQAAGIAEVAGAI